MGDGYIWVEMKGHREKEEGWISDNFESLRNVGVLSEGSLHVCGGALHITAVVQVQYSTSTAVQVQVQVQVGVLSEGSLHVCGGAWHITAVVRGILARAIALSNCRNRIQFNVIKVQVTILYSLDVL